MDSFYPYNNNSGDSQRATHPSQQSQQQNQHLLSQQFNPTNVCRDQLHIPNGLQSGSTTYSSVNGYPHGQPSQQQLQIRSAKSSSYPVSSSNQSSFQQMPQQALARPSNVHNNFKTAPAMVNGKPQNAAAVPNPLLGKGASRSSDQTELLRSMYQTRHLPIAQQVQNSSMLQQMGQQTSHGTPSAYYQQIQSAPLAQQHPNQQGYATASANNYSSQSYHTPNPRTAQAQNYNMSSSHVPSQQLCQSDAYPHVTQQPQQLQNQLHAQMLKNCQTGGNMQSSRLLQSQQHQQLCHNQGYAAQNSQHDHAQTILNHHHISSQPSQSSSLSKQRYNLTSEAKSALREAVLSAIRNNGQIEPDVLQRAMAQGMPKQAIINAVVAAREKDKSTKEEREKKLKELHNLQVDRGQSIPGQIFTESRQSYPGSISHNGEHSYSQPSCSNSTMQYLSAQPRQPSYQQVIQQQVANKAQIEKAAADAAIRERMMEEQRKKQQLEAQQKRDIQKRQLEDIKKRKEIEVMRVAAEAEAKRNVFLRETMKPWGRISCALVVKQGSKGCENRSSATAPGVASRMVHPNSFCGGTTRCLDKSPALIKALMMKQGQPKTIEGKLASMSPERIKSLATQLRLQLQKQHPQLHTVALTTDTILSSSPSCSKLRSQKNARIAAKLLEPHLYKRFKLQPKRDGKILEKHIRRARTTTADSIAKRHKDLIKAITVHQVEFYKFHRSKRTDAARLARAVRDQLNKAEKQKEKESDQAERARIAALRSNDMAAYTSLLEDTKNERLKFLIDKTDDCMNQISLLLSSRVEEEQEDIKKMGGEGTIKPTFSGTATGGNYYETAHVKSEQVRQPSMLVGGDLKEYQLSGLQWLVSLYNNRLNGILADEMGLGKTIQTISLIAYLIEMKNNLGPYLVIVPLSTLSNWVNEFSKWLPAATVVCYKGTPQQRKDLFRNEVADGQFNVLLTTYEFVIRDKGSLRKLTWQYAIVDEGHRMKNNQSKFAVTLGTQYNTRRRILLTGTPLQNNLPELWALLNFLLPAVFNSSETFDQWFNKPFSSFGKTGVGENADESSEELLSNEERMLVIHRLHELLRPFMLRRVKSEVLDQLPEKIEKVIRCELSSWQKELYKQISTKIIGEANGKNFNRGLNNVVMHLRKVCNHPFLFSKEGYHINEDIIRASGKVDLLDKILPKLKAAGHRVLMFTQMTKMMPILEDYFAFRGFPCIRLDGSTTADEREKRMYMFNAPDSPYFIFLLSTRAGGLGLNLATADTVIIFDSDWNPMMDLQAQDRAHRIGQRKDVRVFRIITHSPVEERILSRATEKLHMNELVVEAGKFDKAGQDQQEGSSLERLKMMELLLTDFDQFQNGQPASAIPSDEDYDKDCSEEEDGKELFNEMISSNDDDFKLYCQMDLAKHNAFTLYTDLESVPDWIRYPNGKPEEGSDLAEAELVETQKKRRAAEGIVYDDGMTESQFCRMMDKQADDEEVVKKKRKKKRSRNAVDPSLIIDDFNGRKRAKVQPLDQDISYSRQKPPTISDKSGSDEVTPVVCERLISITRSIIYFKEKGTNRRVSELFLEKPCPTTYPDYYQLIDNPIGMNDILRKCRANLYSTVNDFRHDWTTLFKNALTYNGEGSWVVTDADTLNAEFMRLMKKNTLADGPKKPLRIKLSLKKDPKNYSSDEKMHVNDTPLSKSNVTSLPPSEVAESNDSDSSSEYDSDLVEDSLNSVSGMEEREASESKHFKVKSGGLGSRGGLTRLVRR